MQAKSNLSYSASTRKSYRVPFTPAHPVRAESEFLAVAPGAEAPAAVFSAALSSSLKKAAVPLLTPEGYWEAYGKRAGPAGMQRGTLTGARHRLAVQLR